MENEALKPCPFCGSHNITAMLGMGEYWVLCSDCNASCNVSGECLPTKEKAITAWNRRASVDAEKIANNYCETCIYTRNCYVKSNCDIRNKIVAAIKKEV